MWELLKSGSLMGFSQVLASFSLYASQNIRWQFPKQSSMNVAPLHPFLTNNSRVSGTGTEVGIRGFSWSHQGDWDERIGPSSSTLSVLGRGSHPAVLGMELDQRLAKPEP